ncbi:armadillo repeat protein [Colletotrichum sp. SAR11_240]|nr:armadillo repeat protein [Colletotrichum sp. SAR11_240]
MARSSSPPILSQILSARSYIEQTSALRALKNDIVGHAQKKEQWARRGVLEPIVKILNAARSPAKVNGKDGAPHGSPRSISEEETVRFQALQLLASFANGGTAFVEPILAAGALPALLANVCPISNAPLLVTTALRALLNIVESSALATPDSPVDTQALAEAVFAPEHIESLHAILSGASNTAAQQTQIALVANIISKLCREERHQLALANSDVLDSLATRLASIAFTPAKEIRAPWNSLEISGLGYARQQSLTAMDYLLPAIPIHQGRLSGSQQSHFPSLGVSDARERARSAASKYSSTASVWEASRFELFGNEGEPEEDQETPLIPWLILLVRTRQNVERLMAANLLTTLFRSGFGSKHLRETSLGLLVVPVLMDMLDQLQASPPVVKSPLVDADTAMKWTILERTPAILARMITDSEHLQKAAYDCGAVKSFSKLLKDAYEPIPPSAYAKLWSPQADTGMELESTYPSCALGPEGQPPLLAHKVRMRESALKAIGALAAGKDEYRKAFVEQDVVAHIVQSLSPTPGKPSNPKDRSKNSEPDGHVLADKGVMKILCEHAHSLNAALRLNALWALKHFVHAVDPETKKQCLEELESGWLVQLICDDTEDDALFLARSKMDKQNAIDVGDDVDGDVEMDQPDSLSRSWLSSSIPPQDVDGKRPAKFRQTEARLAALREAELNPLRKARNDDLAIQEQGLDFIRNLIGAAGSGSSTESANETTEMIDYLFSELGQDRFFDILARKLQAKVLHPTSRRSVGSAAGREARVLYPQAKIIEAVVFILVHMAASIPKHRQLVIAQTDLLKLLANHFNSKDKEVRVALCHLISNLTWQDDESDARACAQRAYELKKLGFLTKLEGLEDDCELDVRERAKSAVWQMKQVSSY